VLKLLQKLFAASDCFIVGIEPKLRRLKWQEESGNARSSTKRDATEEEKCV